MRRNRSAGFLCSRDVNNNGPALEQRTSSTAGCQSACAARAGCSLFVHNKYGQCFLKTEAVVDRPADPRHGTVTCARERALQELQHRKCVCASMPRHRPDIIQQGLYLGFSGDNLGDRLMFETAACAIHCASRGRAVLLPAVSAVGLRDSHAFLVLGGGSLLNAGGHFEPLVAAFVGWCHTRPHRCLVAGTGWDDNSLAALPRTLTSTVVEPTELADWHAAVGKALNSSIPRLLPPETLAHWAALDRMLTPRLQAGVRRVRGGVRGALTASALRAASSATASPLAATGIDLGLAAASLLSWHRAPPDADSEEAGAIGRAARGRALCLIVANSSDGAYSGDLANEHEALVVFAASWWRRSTRRGCGRRARPSHASCGGPVRFLSIFNGEARDVQAARGLRDRALARARAADEPASDPAGGAAIEAAALATPRALLETLHRCGLVVSHKLHGGIVSDSLGVPTVALAYRPKHFDFAASTAAAHDNASSSSSATEPQQPPLFLETLLPMAAVSEFSLNVASDQALARDRPPYVAAARAAGEAAASWWLAEAEAMLAADDYTPRVPLLK